MVVEEIDGPIADLFNVGNMDLRGVEQSLQRDAGLEKEQR